MEPVEYPVDGILDLHVFDPRDVKDLVPEYLRACRERGIVRVRIIHGKGTGTLRRTVHHILDRLPEVIDYCLAHQDAGSWGATIVTVTPPDE
ncbi:MAG: Smr/MutS family protein [Rhodothermales bacterium]